MRDFLLFTLYAPLASWGEIAVGETRGSWDRPSRSALLGLLAAALGVPRDDQSAHDALDEGYGVAVRLDVPGRPLVDYHTTQSVAESAIRKRRIASRRELLNAVSPDRRQTILSRRTYRLDTLATAAIWVRGTPYRALGDLADALRRPRFVLYAGRKANAFGLPLAPTIVSASTLAEAFGTRAAPPRELAALRAATAGGAREVAHDPCEGFESGLQAIRRETRRDTHPHRSRWHFRERVVEVGLINDAVSALASGGES